MDFIRVYENAVDESFCDEIIELCKQNNDFIDLNALNEKYKNLILKINRKVIKYIKKYINSIPNNIRHASYNNHFKECSVFRECAVEKTKCYNIWVNDDSVHESRILSFKLCLNTIGEDEGGCIEFSSGEKIRPKKGSLIIHPSHWVFSYRILPTLNDVEHYMCYGSYVDIEASMSSYTEPKINKHILIKEDERLQVNGNEDSNYPSSYAKN